MTVEQGDAEMVNSQLLRLAVYIKQREFQEAGGVDEGVEDNDI